MTVTNIAGISLEIERQGTGRNLLYLHPEYYFSWQQPFVCALAEDWHVVMPHHPGFKANARKNELRTVGDLAYLYLELLDELDLGQVVVVGSSFGGWIALEMAVRNCTRIESLVLLAPFGVKLSSRESRDFADIHAMSHDDALSCLFYDPAANGPNYALLNDESMTAIAHERQALAYYAWQPYLHNPELLRWLGRVRCPTLLLWGEQDGWVSVDYAHALAERLPQATLNVVPQCGHYPQLESPGAVIAALKARLAHRA